MAHHLFRFIWLAAVIAIVPLLGMECLDTSPKRSSALFPVLANSTVVLCHKVSEYIMVPVVPKLGVQPITKLAARILSRFHSHVSDNFLDQ